MRKQLLFAVTAVLGIALDFLAMNASGFETAQSVTATPISSVPFVISASGNYYLPASLASSSPGVAITINADKVTLDLNGQTLTATGAAASPNVGIGVAVLDHQDVIIQNGNIDGFGAYGVLLDATDGKREHNQKNLIKTLNFNYDQIGILTVAGSINEVEFCDFDNDAVGIYDINSLGGDRFQSDNFENMIKRASLTLGAGVVTVGGNGTLTEDCLFANCQDAGIIDQGVQDRIRFNSFVNNGATHIGGLSLGLADN